MMMVMSSSHILSFYPQILRSEVENNLNASFVIIGLVASVGANVTDSMWKNFTRRTLFLRPNVKTLVYCDRVLSSQRAAFEREHNATIKTVTSNGTWVDRAPDSEYAPIIYETDDIQLYLFDAGSVPILQKALFFARDTGLFTLSPPSPFQGSWQMGAYLAYYGQGLDGTTFSSDSARKDACIGYVATVLNIIEVFGAVLSRYADS